MPNVTYIVVLARPREVHVPLYHKTIFIFSLVSNLHNNSLCQVPLFPDILPLFPWFPKLFKNVPCSFYSSPGLEPLPATSQVTARDNRNSKMSPDNIIGSDIKSIRIEYSSRQINKCYPVPSENSTLPCSVNVISRFPLIVAMFHSCSPKPLGGSHLSIVHSLFTSSS